MKDDPIAVVGGGLGGLAAACTLAARGHRTIVFERNGWIGGKAAEHRVGGVDGDWRFDMGPTILTMPSVLRRIFAEAGRSLDDELTLRRLDPQWRAFFEDGSVLDLSADAAVMDERLASFAGRRDADGYAAFTAYARRLNDIARRHFFFRPIGGIGDMFDAGTMFHAGTLADVLAMRMGRSVAGTIRSHVRDARVAQMLDHFTQYVGSSPYGSPAILCSIADIQLGEGIWYPLGGIRAVPEALTRLADALGVEMRPRCGVDGIEQRDGRVTAVRTADGDRIVVQAVVCNMDSVRAMRELVGGQAARRFLRRRRYEPACSGVVLYLALDRAYEHLAHHDFVFSRDPEEEFDHIYRRGEPAPDPTCYLAAPARSDPDVAPPGGEALYALVHTPYLRTRHDWRRMLGPYRRVILDKLARCAGMEDIERRIVHVHVLTPQDIHDRYRVLDGAIYGLASHGRFLGAFKPGNRSPDLGGLYFAGGSAHPGPGMPMVLMSGWIAADACDRDLGGAERVPA